MILKFKKPSNHLLDFFITKEKKRLDYLIETSGIASSVTIEQSQKLDNLIVSYMRQTNNLLQQTTNTY